MPNQNSRNTTRPKQKKKRNVQQRHPAGRNPAANMGNRGRNVRSSASINNIYRKHRGNKGYSETASRVLQQTSNIEVSEEPVLQSMTMSAVSSLGQQYAIHQTAPAAGIVTKHKTRVSVVVGSQGFGFLAIRHAATIGGGAALPAGTILNDKARHADVIHTATGYTGSSFNFSTLNLGTTGTNGVVGSSTCVQSPYSTTAITSSNGGIMSCVLGQKISLVANRSAVASRQGQISVKQFKGNIIDLNINAFDGLARAQIFDASNLTEDSSFSTHRPALTCGKWIRSFSSATNVDHSWGSGTGVCATDYLYSGFTGIVIEGASGDIIVFEVETLMAYAGVQVPVQVNFCYDPHAYSITSCGATTASQATYTTDKRDERAVKRETEKTMEKATASSVPGFVVDGLLQGASTIFDRVMESSLFL